MPVNLAPPIHMETFCKIAVVQGGEGGHMEKEFDLVRNKDARVDPAMRQFLDQRLLPGAPRLFDKRLAAPPHQLLPSRFFSELRLHIPPRRRAIYCTDQFLRSIQ
jgi:hypothetical protein